MLDFMLPFFARLNGTAPSLNRHAGSRWGASRTSRFLFVGLVVSALGFSALSAPAQATMATASRKADLQVGGYFVLAPAPDYGTTTLKGAGGYATFDFTEHFGVEINFREAVSPNVNHVYEKVYEAGGRYVRHYGRIHPYVRASYGRGVFNFPNDSANLAYNLFAAGAGADFILKKHVNLRADYDYQHWLSFPGGSLTPQMLSAGVAYHF